MAKDRHKGGKKHNKKANNLPGIEAAIVRTKNATLAYVRWRAQTNAMATGVPVAAGMISGDPSSHNPKSLNVLTTKNEFLACYQSFAVTILKSCGTSCEAIANRLHLPEQYQTAAPETNFTTLAFKNGF